MKEWLHNNRWFLLVTVFCLLPLFFINVKDSHDWGDDFAQYLLQAENIIKGKPQTETGYVYDPRFPVVAPPAYPAGFPLMLAPVYAVRGHSILHYNLLITFVLFLFCLMMAIFFRNYFSWYASLLLVMLFAYNAWTLDFKTNILSDFPFALFLLLSTTLYLRMRTLQGALAVGASVALMLLTRGVGFVFLVAVLLQGMVLFFRRKNAEEGKKVLLHLAVIAGVSLTLQTLVNTVLFHIPSEGFFTFYKKAYDGKDIGDTVILNLNYYVEVFKAFFQPWVERWTFVSSAAASLSLVLLLAGMIYSLLKERSFMDLLAWLYILLFLLYPYSAGGFRFIMPVIPFLLVYMVRGLLAFRITEHVSRPALVLAAFVFAFLLYQPGVTKILESQKNIPEGPQRDYAQELFTYINMHLAPQDLVLFKKPKALALYSHVRTCSTVYDQQPSDVASVCDNLGVGYLLLTKDAADAPLENFIRSYPARVALQWQNDHFTFYKVLH